MTDLDTLWANLLSRDPDIILETWYTLSPNNQEAIYAHLVRMVSEEGWAEPQQLSAQAALDALASDEETDLDKSAPDIP